MSLQLIPAVELLLLNAAAEIAPPLSDAREACDESIARREAQFRSSRLEPVESVSPGSRMIPVSAVLNRADILTALLDEHLLQSPLLSLPANNVMDVYEGVKTLSGGLAVVHEGICLLEPQCCCDLNNICDWSDAMSYRGNDEGAFLWTGHPHLLIWYREGRLVLQLESDPSISFAVTPTQIQNALAPAITLQREFSRALEPILADRFGATSKLACDCLAGLLEFDHPEAFTDEDRR
jgi:hypothetical protein